MNDRIRQAHDPEASGFETSSTRRRKADAWILVCAVICILAIAIPDYLTHARRARQKVTVGNIIRVRQAISEYGKKTGHYPDVTTIKELVKLLEPTYLKITPLVDGWGWPLEYRHINKEDLAAHGITHTKYREPSDGFVIRSPGSDGIFQYQDPFNYPDMSFTTRASDDIVWGTDVWQFYDGMHPG